jgi:hypothetical protein
LSLQAGLPLGRPSPAEFERQATRILPADFVRRWKVMPYRVALGQLHLVTSEVPSERMVREVVELSKLDVRFRLVAPADLARIHAEYLPEAS